MQVMSWKGIWRMVLKMILLYLSDLTFSLGGKEKQTNICFFMYISSESTFSTRVIDSSCSFLNPSTIEALICTQNCIKSSKIIDL